MSNSSAVFLTPPSPKILYFFSSLGPITNADSLDYHAGVAAYILNYGQYPDLKIWFHSIQAGAGEVLISLSFFLKSDDSLGANARYLSEISFDVYTQYHRIIDDEATTGDYALPLHVYPTPDGKFGITPLPDKTYAVEYKYFSLEGTICA